MPLSSKCNLHEERRDGICWHAQSISYSKVNRLMLSMDTIAKTHSYIYASVEHNPRHVCVTANSLFHVHSKYSDLDYHFVWENVAISLVIRHFSTCSQLDDIYTKSLPKYYFTKFRDKLGRLSYSSSSLTVHIKGYTIPMILRILLIQIKQEKNYVIIDRLKLILVIWNEFPLTKINFQWHATN